MYLPMNKELQYFSRHTVHCLPSMPVRSLWQGLVGRGAAERGWRSLPITEIQSALDGLMLDNFRVTKAHSITRDGKSVRGFRGVALC